jgi:hypothetical protein
LSFEGKGCVAKRNQIFLLALYLVFFYKKTFQERGCVAKTFFGRFEAFSYQKTSSFLVCGK